MKNVHATIYSISIVFLCSFGVCLNMENSYIAAVVDYSHIYSRYPKELLKENVEQYLQLMRNASREYADIIVFPEFGLVDIHIMLSTVHGNSSLDEYGTFVPDPDLEIVPCEDTKMENFSMHLISISCAARLHSLYTVVNVLEKAQNNETSRLEFYNTNVVFDRLGTVIARYRKINLSEEPFLRPGTELVTFETDFGVTFGIFTCFDILFQHPALEVLECANVTDIIFTTSWYSETPFLQGLSIQHGYAKRNGVNLLGAGLQESSMSVGGSGIFLANGSIAEAFITASRKTKIIIQEVPIIKETTPGSTCMNPLERFLNSPVSEGAVSSQWRQKRETERSNDIDNFVIMRENITGYVLEPLAKGPKTFTQVCAEGKEFCCTFSVTVDKSSLNNEQLDYTYMLGAYKGLSRYGSNYYGGIRVCALLACLNESDTDTCGHKLNTSLTPIKFKSIHITASVDKTNDSYNQPATLRHDLTSVSDYTYCEYDVKDTTRTKIVMHTRSPQESILTFGIYGRMFSEDMVVITTAPPPLEVTPLNYTLIIMIVSFSIILFICSAGLLYKFCMNES